MKTPIRRAVTALAALGFATTMSGCLLNSSRGGDEPQTSPEAIQTPTPEPTGPTAPAIVNAFDGFRSVESGDDGVARPDFTSGIDCTEEHMYHVFATVPVDASFLAGASDGEAPSGVARTIGSKS